MSVNEEPLAIARLLGQALEAAGAGWAVGGSVASSVHGVPRATADVDFIVAIAPARVGDLATAARDFLMDAETLRDQLRQGRAYNVFHAATMTKVDLFPAAGAFERNQLARASLVAGVRVISAEDALLAKLRWFRLGGEISDRQWRDVLGIVAIGRPTLDRAHLEHWAAQLQVTDLLQRALQDSSGGL